MDKITNTSPNFGSKYLLKGGLKEINQLRNEIIPTFKLVTKSPVFPISTDEYFKEPMRKSVAEIAKQTGEGGAEWLVQNAERNYGVKVNLKDNNDIFVFTGKDTLKLGKFMRQRQTLAGQIKTQFEIFKNALSLTFAETPKHITNLKFLNKYIEKEQNKFYKFASKDCKKVNNMQDLLVNMAKDNYK